MIATEEIISKLKSSKTELEQKYPIATMALFGSVARGEQLKSSDVDIVVEFNGHVGSRFIELADEMERLLGVSVDLVSRKGIKEKYFRIIEKDLIYV